EMSVNWSGAHPELRLLFDWLGDPPGKAGDARSGTMTAIRRLRQIHEIFKRPAGRLSPAPLWHSVAWRVPLRAIQKTYFGLFEWPHAQRHAAVGEAMERLGMAAAWDDARRRVEEADGRREIEFFAVDLA